jgi:hypothetical protein
LFAVNGSRATHAAATSTLARTLSAAEHACAADREGPVRRVGVDPSRLDAGRRDRVSTRDLTPLTPEIDF